MIKQAFLAFFLSVIAGTVCAEQADPCGGMTGFALSECRGNQQKLQEQQLEQQQRELQQQLQQQQERQKTCPLLRGTMSRANRDSLHSDKIQWFARTALHLETELNCFLNPRHELIK